MQTIDWATLRPEAAAKKGAGLELAVFLAEREGQAVIETLLGLTRPPSADEVAPLVRLCERFTLVSETTAAASVPLVSLPAVLDHPLVRVVDAVSLAPIS